MTEKEKDRIAAAVLWLVSDLRDWQRDEARKPTDFGCYPQATSGSVNGTKGGL